MELRFKNEFSKYKIYKKKMFTIENLQKYASNYNGECLSTEYKRSDTNYEWICENKHTFTKNWSNIRRGKRKVFCLQCTLPSIQNLQQLAITKGGKCLSSEYINSNTKYDWECEQGHQWKAAWINVGYKNATWCPDCKLWSFEKFQEYAIKKGGKCLEVISGNGLRGRYLWECEDGHQWNTLGGSIVGGDSWCPECQKLTLQDCINEAEKRGGICLDTEYINKRTIMNWKCSNEHEFKLRLGAVRNNNRWCRQCFHDRERHDLSVAQELAIKNGGECLSTEYVNLETPLKWRCKEGHEWEVAMSGIKALDHWCRICHMRSRRDKAIIRIRNWAKKLGGYIITKNEDIPYDVKCNTINVELLCSKKHKWTTEFQTIQNGTWCPKCRFKSESKCKDIFEDIFKISFVKRRLECIERLELDGYSEELQLAFEYNGKQHYEYIPHFHRNGEEDLENVQERDERKIRLCKENNITLITIPFEYDYTKPDELEEYILERLEEVGLVVVIY